MHGTIERKSPHWAVCQVLSHRAPRVREEIEKIGHGAFVPTYQRRRIVAGRLFEKEVPLMPGYLFFLSDPNEWGAIGAIDGVFRVLANCGAASRVSFKEMERMLVDSFVGAHDDKQATVQDGSQYRRYSKRRRRPRPGKRLRAANDR